MANSKIFASASTGASRKSTATDTVNKAGGKAYALSDKEALAQMAVTGVFNDTFYATGKTQLDDVKELVAKVSPEFIGKLAVYARDKAYMKDLPAYLCAVLAERDVDVLSKVFDRVIDNGKMLRNFTQMIRSGQAGRRSLGTRPKKLVAKWLVEASDSQLLAASVGNEPSIGDVIRLSHPKAKDAARAAFFGRLTGRKVEDGALPQLLQDLDRFRKGEGELPKVPFELLTSLELDDSHWVAIARNASWTQTRMNLNTFARHNVFKTKEMRDLVANRLADSAQIERARVFPYQLLAAYLNCDEGVPSNVRNALQDAMQHALRNVPKLDTAPAVLVDTSGSMSNAVTGNRKGATSKIRNVDVAALFGSAILSQNPEATIVPFDTKVHSANLNGRDSVMTNAAKLAKFGGGGTDCSRALRHLNSNGSDAKLVIFVSDNESWVDSTRYAVGTGVMVEWENYKRRVPDAKLVCIDISPNRTSQAKNRKDILNVGGFSDAVFNIVNLFARGELTGAHWVGEIEKIEL